ncbi:MAG: DUF6350 family protein, partial [Pontimonas sp.]
MKARFAVLVTALETLVVVGIGVGIFFAPLSVVWALDDQFATDLLVYWRASADIWLLGHGVPLNVSLPPDTAQGLGLVASQSQFVLSVAPLGPALLTLWFGFRMGRRDMVLDFPVVVWLTSLLTLVGLSWAVAWSARHEVAAFALAEAVIAPSLFMASGLIIASWTTKWSPGRLWLQQVIPPAGWQVISSGVRAGIGAFALLIAAVSVFFATSLVLSYATVIGLFESLGPSVVGLVTLFVAQLVFVPTLVVWLAAWFIGPGFQLGQAAQFSPLGADIQALPALPILGALPGEAGPAGFGVLSVALIAAVIAAALSERGLGYAVGDTFWVRGAALFTQPPIRGVLTALVATATAVVVLWIPAVLVTGSLGPGRFSTVGLDIPAVLLWWAIEVALGTLLGLLAGRGLRWIRAQEQHAPQRVAR